MTGYLSTTDVLEELKVSRTKVYALIKSKKLKCSKKGRNYKIRPEDLQEYMDTIKLKIYVPKKLQENDDNNEDEYLNNDYELAFLENEENFDEDYIKPIPEIDDNLDKNTEPLFAEFRRLFNNIHRCNEGNTVVESTKESVEENS